MTQSKNEPLTWSAHSAFDDLIKNEMEKFVTLGAISSLMAVIPLIFPFLGFTIFVTIFCNLIICFVHVFMLRRYLYNPAKRRLNPKRLLIVRWVGRFGTLALISGIYTPSILWLAVVACPTGFYGYAFFYSRYLSWQIRREINKEPLLFVEKLILGVFVFVSLSIFSVLIFFALLSGFFVQWMMSIYG